MYVCMYVCIYKVWNEENIVRFAFPLDNWRGRDMELEVIFA